MKVGTADWRRSQKDSGSLLQFGAKVKKNKRIYCSLERPPKRMQKIVCESEWRTKSMRASTAVWRARQEAWKNRLQTGGNLKKRIRVQCKLE